MGDVLRLPATAAGRVALRRSVRLAGSWTLPDGSCAPDHDWDRLAQDADATADGPNIFEFWVPALDDKSRHERQRLIRLAHQHGVVDDRTADTLSVMWSDRDREER